MGGHKKVKLVLCQFKKSACESQLFGLESFYNGHKWNHELNHLISRALKCYFQPITAIMLPKVVLKLALLSLASAAINIKNGRLSLLDSNSTQSPKLTNYDLKENEDSSTRSSSGGLSTIEVFGSKFFTVEDGNQFFIKGIAYQPSKVAGDIVALDSGNIKFIDPLGEPKICLRDLDYLQRLGVNTVRVYSIDTDLDHDVCMEAFEKAGIYVIADLSEPDVSVIRDSPTWDVTIFDRYKKVVDSLHKYPNVLGFFAGNEVTNDKTNTFASPFVKSSIRDVKSYIDEKGYRKIPVGYSTNDDAETRANVADFFACGDVQADFYGINMYEWCGHSTYWSSGYKDRTEEFKDYPVPIFFSEFGCNVKRPRPFTEVDVLYSRLMNHVWSGGIAYMYFEEPNQYGVVKVSDGVVEELPDFQNLEREFNRVDPQGATIDEYKELYKEPKFPNCPISTKSWESSSEIPHTPDEVKCECLESSLQCGLAPFVRSDNLTHVFDYACNIVDCEAINSDGKLGSYGFFSDCSSRQKASYVINEVFLELGGKPDTCDFEGVAVLNNKLATQNELESTLTLTGDTCLDVLKANDAKKIKSKTSGKSNNVTIGRNGTLGRGNYTGDELENKASQIQFYSNLNTIALISLVLVFILPFLD
ncbi:hypothetical protein BN7_5215 [Wickerhamomyces ciferrii]|uniref:1,3-beta-glucanosyltransferase n=1 Tax=Wickerhamomyces ciferrii (strain ATCC 14091 / BCRC 22168 / CBS 111 / JCM 3599 / NBRC 0793 / NRRL Y-1031 F-60-10) TaxID=1206466 RepID=K0KUG7_WICCF|nr:uncharacterized protein BN7_5215 [Wickerhamomyces ciferrii]CCH45632.1 hypothetical protein BN7_5215 [Wickerhamomyces ciferrii]